MNERRKTMQESTNKAACDAGWEALKKALFMAGTEAIEDFLGYSLDTDEEDDTVENRLDEAYAQMPDDEIGRFMELHGIGTGDGEHADEKEYTVKIAVTGSYSAIVTARNADEAIAKANEICGDADFGELKDIDWEDGKITGVRRIAPLKKRKGMLIRQMKSDWSDGGTIINTDAAERIWVEDYPDLNHEEAQILAQLKGQEMIIVLGDYDNVECAECAMDLLCDALRRGDSFFEMPVITK